MKVEGQPAFVLTYDEMVKYMGDNLAVAKTWLQRSLGVNGPAKPRATELICSVRKLKIRY
jgi:hypothetical protein